MKLKLIFCNCSAKNIEDYNNKYWKILDHRFEKITLTKSKMLPFFTKHHTNHPIDVNITFTNTTFTGSPDHLKPIISKALFTLGIKDEMFIGSCLLLPGGTVAAPVLELPADKPEPKAFCKAVFAVLQYVAGYNKNVSEEEIKSIAVEVPDPLVFGEIIKGFALGERAVKKNGVPEEWSPYGLIGRT